MSTQADSLPAIEVLMILSAQIKLVTAVNGLPAGERMIFDVTSGSFAGPRLAGQVLATGGDWVTRTSTSSQINVRLALATNDGVTILLQYSGRASQDNGQVRIEVAGTFEAPAGSYAWLNNVQAFGRGVVTAEETRYHFYRFK